MLPTLGIIAGDGDLPREIAALYSKNGGKCFIASIGQAESWADISYKSFAIGAVGGILEYFKENLVENVIIVGGIKRPNLSSLKVDISGSVLLAHILKQKILGDDNVLKIVSEYIGSKGFTVISPKEILKFSDYEVAVCSKKSASKQDKIDIEIGKKVIESLGALDVGQSVIVCDGYVVGIEAAEGTDNLIKRCALLRNKASGGVLVKLAKSGQDRRLDTPVIGPQTIMCLAQHGFNGVAIEKNGVIVIKP